MWTGSVLTESRTEATVLVSEAGRELPERDEQSPNQRCRRNDQSDDPEGL